MNGYNFFKIQRAIEFHLTKKDYNIIKFYGKGANNSVESYEKLNSGKVIRMEYYGLRMPDAKTCYDFCIANTMFGETRWLYESYEDSRAVYSGWLKYLNSLRQNLEYEYKLLHRIKEEKGCSLSFFFTKTESGKNPPLMQLWLHREVSAEFLCHIDKSRRFIDNWNSLFSNDPLLSKRVLALSKYRILFPHIEQEFLKS